jgi:hypothetical protein
MNVGLVFWITKVLCNEISPLSKYWLPLWGKILLTISLPFPEMAWQWSGNRASMVISLGT